MSKTVVMGHIEASSLPPLLSFFLYFPFMYSSCVFSTLGPEIFFALRGVVHLSLFSIALSQERERGIHIYHDTPEIFDRVYTSIRLRLKRKS